MKRLKRILVVEDEAVTALDLEKMLVESGHSVVGIAKTCEEALQLAENHNPDVVLMDYNLKGELNGATAARELDLQKVRVIFLTAHPVEAFSEFQCGNFEFLPKPIRRHDLTLLLAAADRCPSRERA